MARSYRTGSARRAGRADSVSGYIARVLAEDEKRESLKTLLQDRVERHGAPSHLARSCGELCAATDRSDIIDASVFLLARQRRDPIATSDPIDLSRLDPSAQIIPI